MCAHSCVQVSLRCPPVGLGAHQLGKAGSCQLDMSTCLCLHSTDVTHVYHTWIFYVGAGDQTQANDEQFTSWVTCSAMIITFKKTLSFLSHWVGGRDHKNNSQQWGVLGSIKKCLLLLHPKLLVLGTHCPVHLLVIAKSFIQRCRYIFVSDPILKTHMIAGTVGSGSLLC